jgi:hypothetical protein
VLCLPPRVSAQEAIEKFNQRKLRNLYGLLLKDIRVAAPGEPASRVPPFIERLWLPAYAVCVHAYLRDKESRVWTTVDGLAGYSMFMDNVHELELRDLSEDAYPPGVTPEQAEAAARKGLLQYILRQRGQFNKPIIDAVEEVRLFHRPVWVLYYHRVGKNLDIKALDAYSGAPGGAKMRVAVLDALMNARKTRLATEPAQL